MQYLIVEPFAGLGNRLRALTASMRLARKMKRQLGVVWSLDPYHCWCPFNRLFENNFFFTTEHFSSNLFWEKYSVKREPNRIQPTKADIFIREENFCYLPEDEGIMWGQFGPNNFQNREIAEELLFEFRQLTPIQYVKNAVDEFVDGRTFSCSMHIRREDNIWSNRYCPNFMFFDAIQKTICSRPGKIFLATDCHITEQVFRKRYGSRLITYQTRSLSRGSSPEAIQDALIIMLILAKTEVIFRSSSSTFSQVAAWFGNTKTVEVGKLEHSF